MKGMPGAMKGVMMGATLASMMMMGGARAEARSPRVEDLVARKLEYQSARAELGDQLYACWKNSNVVVASSHLGWQKEMERVNGNLCVLPAPSAPKENWSRHGLVVVSWSDGAHMNSSMTLNVRGVSRIGNKLMVDVSLTPRVDGCGYCDQDEIRLSHKDVAGVKTVLVSYSDDSQGGVALASTSVEVQGADDPATISWGALKAMYR